MLKDSTYPPGRHSTQRRIICADNLCCRCASLRQPFIFEGSQKCCARIIWFSLKGHKGRQHCAPAGNLCIQGLQMKTEYVFAMAVLLWCLIIGSAQAEPVQASSESKAVGNRNVPDENVAPAFTVPSGAIVPPSELSTTKPVEKGAPGVTLPSGPMAADLIGGVQRPTKPDDVPLVIKLPGGAVVAPSGELLGAQNTTNSTPVTNSTNQRGSPR